MPPKNPKKVSGKLRLMERIFAFRGSLAPRSKAEKEAAQRVGALYAKEGAKKKLPKAVIESFQNVFGKRKNGRE